MNGAFYLLIDWLNLENLEDLLNYVRDREIQARGTFSKADIRCMTLLRSRTERKTSSRLLTSAGIIVDVSLAITDSFHFIDTHFHFGTKTT